jgi:regulator of cell morphogenesis and NO signaling
MNITQNNNIGQLVALDYRTAPVFKRYGIDFCCNGNRSIADACAGKEIDSNQLITQLQQAIQSNDNTGTDYRSWPLDLLADYIEKKHHRYVTTRIQEITPFMEKVARVHGERHPELIEVEQLFYATAGNLTAHMKKEELMLFPAIRKMVKAQESGETYNMPSFGSVQGIIAEMHTEHDAEGERLRTIDKLTDNYTPPFDACNTYRVTLALLKEFEEDLHMHIHLENNILFPKAIELEKKLL